MRTGEVVLTLDYDGNQYPAGDPRHNDSPYDLNGSQSALVLGNLVLNGGISSTQGIAVWAHQAEPDTRGPFVAYHVPTDGQTNYPTGGYPVNNPMGPPITVMIHETLESQTINDQTVILRPVGGDPISCYLTFPRSDTLTITPKQQLALNTTYEVELVEGGIKDAAGNGMQGYSFTFSTGSSLNGNRAPEISSLTVDSFDIVPGDSVTFTTSASDPEGSPIEYRYDFGDGSEPTAWRSNSSVNHTFSSAGRYTVTV